MQMIITRLGLAYSVVHFLKIGVCDALSAQYHMLTYAGISQLAYVLAYGMLCRCLYSSLLADLLATSAAAPACMLHKIVPTQCCSHVCDLTQTHACADVLFGGSSVPHTSFANVCTYTCMDFCAYI